MGKRTALRFVALIVIAAFGFVALPARGKSGGQDILDRIRDTAGVVSVVEENSGNPGPGSSGSKFEQPVDPQHSRRSGSSASASRSSTATSTRRPYSRSTATTSSSSVQFELTALLRPIRSTSRHRYFLPRDRIRSAGHYALNIAQSAADHHAIVTAFRPLYTAKWVSSGASKAA
ncbi:MAG: hypothetical protein IPF53_15845 [Blastocatellia bacterium]|nr:hypothetical protein [Blastocatellia bacterium]